MVGAAASPSSTRPSPPIVVQQSPAPGTPKVANTQANAQANATANTPANAPATPRANSVHIVGGPTPRSLSYNSPQPPSAPDS